MSLQTREHEEQSAQKNTWWALARTSLATLVASLIFLTVLSVCAYTKPLPKSAALEVKAQARAIDKRLAFEGFESSLVALTRSCFLEAKAKDPSTALEVIVLAKVSANLDGPQLGLELSKGDALFFKGCLKRATREQKTRLNSLEGQEGQFEFRARFENDQSIVELVND